MPNQVPKVFLSQQALTPKSMTKGTPLAGVGEGLAGVLSSIAGALPELPVPALPAMATPGMAPPKISEFLTTMEASLPSAVPKVSDMLTKAEGITGGRSKIPLVFE